jgi:hypothetical protein
MSRHVQTIEQTGKIWKAGQGCGCVTMIVGIVGLAIFFMGPVSSGNGPPWLSMAIAAVGVGCYLFARAMAWWYHG